MKKISWIKRVFMSWNALEEYFSANENQKIQNLEKENQKLNEFNDWVKKRVEKLEKELEGKHIELGQARQENQQFKNKLNVSENTFHNKQKEIVELKNKLEQIRSNKEIQKQGQIILKEIDEKFKTISKIENTFFASTGNKGKGELGEKQVKVILEKSGLPSKFWTENLPVGSKTVEFAVRSGEENKWIPIDSKVLETKLDEDGKAIIDETYKRRVKEKAQEIKKYLNKTNTASYGILVLQSDSIYMKLYELFPLFFQETIANYKIYIASPSSFVQFAWSISQILDIYEKVHEDEEIYDQMISALESVTKFANKLHLVHKDFNIAMDSHYRTIEKKGNDLTKKLVKSNKISEPKLIKKI